MCRYLILSILLLSVVLGASGDYSGLESCLLSDARPINEGDVVLIKVLDPLNGADVAPESKVIVPRAGMLELPTFGEFQLQGKTVGQARKELTSLYKERGDGQVFIALASNVSKRDPIIWTEGFVAFPMRHRWKEGMSLVEAICLSGGIDPRGDHRKVRLLRGEEAVTVDLSNPSGREVPLQPGDRLVVP